jgi:histidinol-phosphate aminotransferase
MRALRPELAELAAYVPCVPEGVRVRLDANEAPSAPEGAQALVREAIERTALSRYPDPRALALKEAIQRRTGADPSTILVGSGSDEVIALLLTALATPLGRSPHPVVMMPTPTFVMYGVTARAHGYKSMPIPLDKDWDLDVASFARAMEFSQPNVVFIASPNNPTGNRMSEDRLIRVIESAKDALVVVDEAYVDYAPASVRSLRERHRNLGILRTLSKVGLAALRIGWLEADAALVSEIDKARQPFNVSATSQAAATAVLHDGWEGVVRLTEQVRRERSRMAEEIGKIAGFAVTPSDANFLWVKTPAPAVSIWEHLVECGILVRSFHAMGGRMTTQLRITIGTRSENDQALEALSSWRG